MYFPLKSNSKQFVCGAIRHAVVSLGMRATKNPGLTVTTIIFLSLLLPIIGLFTNFQLDLNQMEIVKPTNSLPALHHEWITSSDSGFPQIRPFLFIFHNNGENVLTYDNMKHAIQGMEIVLNSAAFEEVCSQSQYLNNEQQPDCRILSATQFWNHDLAIFEEEFRHIEDKEKDDHCK